MPALGNALDFAKYEGRNLRAHQANPAPTSPVSGQIYYNTVDNTLWWYDGGLGQWIPARASDATATAKGVIQLAGDLTGTAAAPVVANGAITSAKILDGTITDTDVATANKDGAVGVPSLRTLGTGTQQAMPGSNSISAISVNNPALADVNLNTHKLINVVDPTAAQDAATKNYVDNTAQGLDAKASVRVAYTTNQTLTGAAVAEGGVTPANGERVLVMGQTTPAQNGIYVVNTAGAWTRATDFDTWAEVPGAFVFVEAGTNADNGFVSTADPGGTLGTTAITWTQFSGAGQITAGAGLTKTGNTIDAGAGVGISIAADTIAVDPAIIPRYYSSATHAAGATWTYTQATHGCRASRGLVVQVRDETSGAWELPDIVVAANGDVTITYGASQTANSKRTTIIG